MTTRNVPDASRVVSTITALSPPSLQLLSLQSLWRSRAPMPTPKPKPHKFTGKHAIPPVLTVKTHNGKWEQPLPRSRDGERASKRGTDHEHVVSIAAGRPMFLIRRSSRDGKQAGGDGPRAHRKHRRTMKQSLSRIQDHDCFLCVYLFMVLQASGGGRTTSTS